MPGINKHTVPVGAREIVMAASGTIVKSFHFIQSNACASPAIFGMQANEFDRAITEIKDIHAITNFEA